MLDSVVSIHHISSCISIVSSLLDAGIPVSAEVCDRLKQDAWRRVKTGHARARSKVKRQGVLVWVYRAAGDSRRERS